MPVLPVKPLSEKDRQKALAWLLREGPKEAGNFAKGAGAGLAGMPVDLVNTVLQAGGHGIPTGDKPVMGSQWLREQMGVPQDSLAATVGEFASPDPYDAVRASLHADDVLQAMTLMGGRDLFHGTGSPDIKKFKPSWHDETSLKGVSLSTNPKEASRYALNETGRRVETGSPNVHPVRLKGTGKVLDQSEFFDMMEKIDPHHELDADELTSAAKRYLQDHDASGISMFNDDEVFVLDPKQIKSKFAKKKK